MYPPILTIFFDQNKTPKMSSTKFFTSLCIIALSFTNGCDVNLGTTVNSDVFHESNGCYKFGGYDGDNLPVYLHTGGQGAILPTFNEDKSTVWAFVGGQTGSGQGVVCQTDSYPKGSPSSDTHIVSCEGYELDGYVEFTCGCDGYHEAHGTSVPTSGFDYSVGDALFETFSPTSSPTGSPTSSPTQSFSSAPTGFNLNNKERGLFSSGNFETFSPSSSPTGAPTTSTDFSRGANVNAYVPGDTSSSSSIFNTSYIGLAGGIMGLDLIW